MKERRVLVKIGLADESTEEAEEEVEKRIFTELSRSCLVVRWLENIDKAALI
ncbi:MAG: hypothetical protein WCC63_07505 [Candidatus Bathyarchaeia archaeon]